MTSTAPGTVTPASDVDVVRAGFAAVSAGDLAAFAAAFHPAATWDHRNDDRFDGVKDGVESIVAFLAESMQLTTGTLAATPQTVLSDGAGHVAVRARISGTRPDGRTLDDTQVLFFTVDDALIRAVDQFVGDPAAVRAFWA